MVYIYAVEGVKSGGPELLHQLAFVLNTIGIASKMVYVENSFPLKITKAKTVKIYEEYCKETEDDIAVIDCAENIVIVPEILFEVFEDIHKATKVAWWLSVDGYKDIVKEKYSLTDEQMQQRECLDFYHFREKKDIFHLAQSYYAIDFLKNQLGVLEAQIDYLSDYIHDSFLQINDEGLEYQRKDMALFNPKKGGWRLKKLIDQTSDEILWVPLENMTRDKMRLHMLLAKVYVDFGTHPGKDRIPREAAISGCCVITGRQGAAANNEDVPIPEEYKFDDKTDIDVQGIRSLILDIFKNFDEHSAKFENYRSVIKGEKERFVRDAIRLFS